MVEIGEKIRLIARAIVGPSTEKLMAKHKEELVQEKDLESARLIKALEKTAVIVSPHDHI